MDPESQIKTLEDNLQQEGLLEFRSAMNRSTFSRFEKEEYELFFTSILRGTLGSDLEFVLKHLPDLEKSIDPIGMAAIQRIGKKTVNRVLSLFVQE